MESKGSNFDKESTRSYCEKESIGSNFVKETIGGDIDKEGHQSECNKEKTETDHNNESIGSNHEENYDLRVWKKKAVDEDDYNVALILSIFHAEGIDSLNINPYITHRIYKVGSWLEIGISCMTTEVYGLPDPEWNQEFCIPLKNPMDCRFLYLEVIRTCSKIDPGTSTGEVLVGKVRLPLPALLTKIVGRFDLVRSEGLGYKAEGHIALAMELRKIRKT